MTLRAHQIQHVPHFDCDRCRGCERCELEADARAERDAENHTDLAEENR